MVRSRAEWKPLYVLGEIWFIWHWSRVLNAPRTYIGRTGKSLDHRLREHRRGSERRRPRVVCSCRARVLLETASGSIAKAMVIDTQTRCMLESWHIQHHYIVPTQQQEGYFARTLCCTIIILTWPFIHLSSSHIFVRVVTIINIFLFPPLISLVSYNYIVVYYCVMSIYIWK